MPPCRSCSGARVTTRSIPGKRRRRGNEVLSFPSSERGIAMAAWEHRYGWNADVYYRYRKYVISKAKAYEGSDRDCADLAISLMIDFAAGLNLCLTFSDATGGTYISKARGLIQPTTKRGWELDDDITWSSKEEYVKAVLKRTSAWDLANYNCRVNQYGPTPGD